MSGNGTPLRIFVIDDEAETREEWTRILQARGAEVTCFPNFGLALDEMRKQRPDVCVIDLNIIGSNMNGIEFAKLLQKQSMNTPLVMVTTEVYAALISHAARTGIETVLKKADVHNSPDLLWESVNAAYSAGAGRSEGISL